MDRRVCHRCERLLTTDGPGARQASCLAGERPRIIAHDWLPTDQSPAWCPKVKEDA